jgi:hypothetical protein
MRSLRGLELWVGVKLAHALRLRGLELWVVKLAHALTPVHGGLELWVGVSWRMRSDCAALNSGSA